MIASRADDKRARRQPHATRRIAPLAATRPAAIVARAQGAVKQAEPSHAVRGPSADREAVETIVIDRDRHVSLLMREGADGSEPTELVKGEGEPVQRDRLEAGPTPSRTHEPGHTREGGGRLPRRAREEKRWKRPHVRIEKPTQGAARVRGCQQRWPVEALGDERVDIRAFQHVDQQHLRRKTARIRPKHDPKPARGCSVLK